MGSMFEARLLLRRSGSTDRTPPTREGGPNELGPMDGMSRKRPKWTPIDEATSLTTLTPNALFFVLMTLFASQTVIATPVAAVPVAPGAGAGVFSRMRPFTCAVSGV